MRKPEIVIKPIHIVIMVLASVLLLAGVYAITPVITAASEAPSAEETAAREGALALLNRDVDAGKEAWIESVCQVSTKNGCQIMRVLYAPAIWPSIEKGKIHADCKITAAEAAGKVVSEGNGSLETQVWKLTGSCAINGADSQRGDLYVLIAKEQAAWKLDHLMTEQEIQALRKTARDGNENE